MRRGGLMVSAQYSASYSRVLARVDALCSWARHFSLFTAVNKCVLTNLMLTVTL